MKKAKNSRERPSNQIFSQIILPFSLFFILVVIGGALLFSGIKSGATDLQLWRDISVLMVLLPLILLGPILMVVVLLNIILLQSAHHRVIGLFDRYKPLILKFARRANSLAQFVVKPIISIKSALALVTKERDKEGTKTYA